MPARCAPARPSHAFQGEADRFEAFRSELQRQRPTITLLDASGGGGLNSATAQEVGETLNRRGRIAGVYSMGGGNMAILTALEQAGQAPTVFIAHDLDEDNLELLCAEKLTVVLHHDLNQDMTALAIVVPDHARSRKKCAAT